MRVCVPLCGGDCARSTEYYLRHIGQSKSRAHLAWLDKKEFGGSPGACSDAAVEAAVRQGCPREAMQQARPVAPMPVDAPALSGY